MSDLSTPAPHWTARHGKPIIFVILTMVAVGVYLALTIPVARELSLASRDERARVDPAALGLNPQTLGRWSEQAASFEREELEHALELLLDLDRKIKTGETEPEPALELAIVTLCTHLSPAPA
mgnify:CR=1 FL=1